MGRWLSGLLACVVLVMVWYLVADRATPFTSNARVKATITPIIPQVSGTLVQLDVRNGDIVDAGAILGMVDSRAFEIVEARADSA